MGMISIHAERRHRGAAGVRARANCHGERNVSARLLLLLLLRLLPPPLFTCPDGPLQLQSSSQLSIAMASRCTHIQYLDLWLSLSFHWSMLLGAEVASVPCAAHLRTSGSQLSTLTSTAYHRPATDTCIRHSPS